MKKLVLSGFLASEEIYINQLEALLLVRHTHTAKNFLTVTYCLLGSCGSIHVAVLLLLCVGASLCELVVNGHTESRTTVQQFPETVTQHASPC